MGFILNGDTIKVMRGVGVWIFGVLLFLINACHAGQAQSQLPKNCEHDAHTFRCVQYLKNYDADTITVKIQGVHPLIGEKISVRILGIDAAEMRGKSACENRSARDARKLVESQLKKATNIELRNVQRDKYFRILADVAVDGVLIKDMLIKNRLAVSYDGGTKAKVNWCNMGQAGERLPAQK